MDKILLLLIVQLVWMGPVASEAATPAPVPPKTTPVVKSAIPATAKAAPSTPTVTEPAAPAPFYQLYSYYGDRYRDPFIALTGEYRVDQGADRPPQISTLLLKGIIEDAKGRVALLTSGASSYILRGGRLYDGRNHLMKGISGIVKPNSVVLMGSDRTIRELKITATL